MFNALTEFNILVTQQDMSLTISQNTTEMANKL